MPDKERDQERGFKVEDRRRFSDTGEARADEGVQEARGEESVQDEAGQEGTTTHEPPPDLGGGWDERSAPITFPTFVLSLSTQALAHLGEIPHPIEGSTRVDLAAAQEIIDILALLQLKTRGNLEPEESSQIESALYVLRMKYVDRLQHR